MKTRIKKHHTRIRNVTCLLYTSFSLIDKLLFDIIQQSYGEGLKWQRVLRIVLLYFCYNFSVFALFKIKDIISKYTQTAVSAALQKDTISRISKIDYDRFEDNEFYNYITTLKKEINGCLLYTSRCV